jgi:hypothetical protein
LLSSLDIPCWILDIQFCRSKFEVGHSAFDVQLLSRPLPAIPYSSLLFPFPILHSQSSNSPLSPPSDTGTRYRDERQCLPEPPLPLS